MKSNVSVQIYTLSHATIQTESGDCANIVSQSPSKNHFNGNVTLYQKCSAYEYRNSMIDEVESKPKRKKRSSWCEFMHDKQHPSASNGRFTFERIHNTKEQIYFCERAENHKAKERLFESFK